MFREQDPISSSLLNVKTLVFIVLFMILEGTLVLSWSRYDLVEVLLEQVYKLYSAFMKDNLVLNVLSLLIKYDVLCPYFP